MSDLCSDFNSTAVPDMEVHYVIEIHLCEYAWFPCNKVGHAKVGWTNVGHDNIITSWLEDSRVNC